jgi:hypothetical protein
MDDRWLYVGQIREELQMSKDRVWSWIDKGGLPVDRIRCL